MHKTAWAAWAHKHPSYNETHRHGPPLKRHIPHITKEGHPSVPPLSILVVNFFRVMRATLGGLPFQAGSASRRVMSEFTKLVLRF